MIAAVLFRSPLTWLVLLAFTLADICACKTLARRLCFALLMPVLYFLLWLMCASTLGTLSSTILSIVNENVSSGLMTLIPGGICIGLLVIQMFTMASDPRGGLGGIRDPQRRKIPGTTRPVVLLWRNDTLNTRRGINAL